LKTFDTKKSFGSDDLYKLNEAIFNLPEDDRVDAKTTSKLFVVMSQIEKAFGTGKYDKSDANFFYDYIGLLGTMQNQTFFSENQHKTLLGFMSRAAGDGKAAAAPEPEAPAAAPRSSGKDVSRLESENQRLKEEIEKLKALSSAVKLIQTWTMPVAVAEGDAPKKKSRKSRKRKGAKAEEGEGEKDDASDLGVAATAA